MEPYDYPDYPSNNNNSNQNTQQKTTGTSSFVGTAPTSQYPQQQPVQQVVNPTYRTKYCKFCGSIIPEDAVVCTACGRQVEELKSAPVPQSIIVNNTSTSSSSASVNVTATGVPMKAPKNKWISLLLCFFFGAVGAHKFYEGKFLLGIIYICTLGFAGIGVFFDFFAILFKPNPYYV